MRGMQGQVLALLAEEDPSGPLTYAVLHPGRAGADLVVASQGVLAAMQRGGAPAARPARTILILPASVGRLTRAVLPARSEDQARAAAPFLLEDSLATAGADLHFAVGAAQNSEGERLVAVMDQALLGRFLERCRSHGAEPGIVVFDAAALQPSPGEAKAVEVGGRLVIGAGAQGGLSLEPDLARTVALRWLQSLPNPVRRVSYVGADAAALQTALGSAIDVRSAPDASALEVLARDVVTATETAPNLRQGTFGVGPAPDRGRGRGWRLAGCLAAAAVLAHAAAQGVAGFQAAKAADRLESQAEAAFLTLRPDFAEGGDLRAAVRALHNSARLSGAHPAVAVSGPLTEILREQPEARLESLVHEAGSSGVQIVLTSPSPLVLDTVVSALEARGLAVTVSATDIGPDRASRALTLEAVQEDGL